MGMLLDVSDKGCSTARREGLWWRSRLIVAAVTLAYANSQDISACCAKAEGTCWSVCEKMSLVDTSSDKAMLEDRISNIYKFCSPHLLDFWICMNQTLQEVVSGSGWWGRACCAFGSSASCRSACATAANATSLGTSCRRSDEIAFFDCVHKQEEAQWCCSQTQSLTCHDACQKILWRVGQSRVDTAAKERATELCDQSPALLHCLRDLTASTVHTDTSKYLPCCHEAKTQECRTTCESVLRRTGESQEISDVLAQYCGVPAIHDGLWQCFLRKDAPSDTKDLIPHDIAKLHCCQKATTINCRRLCFNTFNTGWQSNWQKFYTECLGDPEEMDLSECVEEVESPCSLGCNGLTYCSQMNNRPTSLFRSCTAQADVEAHLAVAVQKGSGSVTVSGLNLPLKNSTQCPADIWKSVACGLHVKPCTAKGHSSLLCEEDCTKLVSSCVEWSRAPAQLTARALCARLAPKSSSAPCVPLGQFMNPNDSTGDARYTGRVNLSPALLGESWVRLVSEVQNSLERVSEWGRQNLVQFNLSEDASLRILCQESSVRICATVPRNPSFHRKQYWDPWCRHHESCAVFGQLDGQEPPLLSAKESVSSACAGAVCNASQICVINRNCLQGGSCQRYRCVDGCPLGDSSLNVVPFGSWVRVPMAVPSQKLCYKVCRCGNKGLTNCQPLPCVEIENCQLHDKIVLHGEKYYMECNECACVVGERVCARRPCGKNALLTGLPCNCPPHHLPVHTPGKLYPNACLAKCAGATDSEIEFGSRNPCLGVSCGRRQACLPSANVCLSRLQTSCPQHVCVNTTGCNSQPASPVCDTDGRTHANPCHLVMSGRMLAYWGQCLQGCSAVGPVCGVNGVTYISECAAWAEYVSVDYLGPCLAVGPISDQMEPKCSFDRIICPPLKKSKCQGFTAPGACCPKCGGALRVLYSKKQIDRALYGTNISATVINLNNVMRALERYVKIAECALRGYLTIEMEIFITVESILDNPTDLQLNVCVLEAEKLADMINRDSALIASDLGLSALSYALTVHIYPTKSACTVAISLLTVLFTSLSVYVVR